MRFRFLIPLPGILLLVLTFTACGQKDSGAERSSRSETMEKDSAPGPVAPTTETKYLTITAAEAWVRNAPTVDSDSVLFKLPKNAECRVLGTGAGTFEVIGGQLDVWYSIEFEGKEGYVFGSQTDRRQHAEPISGQTRQESWGALTRRLRALMIDKEGNAEGLGLKDSLMFPPCHVAQISPKAGTVAYCIQTSRTGGDGGSRYSFFNFRSDEDSILNCLVADVASGGYHDACYFQLSKEFGFRPVGPLEGVPDTVIRLSSSEWLVITVARMGGGGYGAWEQGMVHAYYLKGSNAVAYHVLEFEAYDSGIGDFPEDQRHVYSDSVSLVYSGDRRSLRLNVISHLKAQVGNAKPARLAETWEKEYIWRGKEKGFVKAGL